MKVPCELIERLKPLAQACGERAHSPYSGVKVGAVVETEDGKTYIGCNVENASYGLTQCAERNALASAIASGATPGSLKVLLVHSTGFASLTPCGACRQVMAELMTPDALVVSCNDSDEASSWNVSGLLPDPFALRGKP